MRRWGLCLALCVAHGASADEHAEDLRDCIKQVLSSFKAIDTDGNGELSKAELQAARGTKGGGKHGKKPRASVPGLEGRYADPNHPGCPRSVNVTASGDVLVSGADESGAPWKLQAQLAGQALSVDFSSKGGPANVTATWTGDAIAWADGNTWRKTTAHTECERTAQPAAAVSVAPVAAASAAATAVAADAAAGVPAAVAVAAPVAGAAEVPAVAASGCNAESTCNGKGKCTADGTCMCEPGYYPPACRYCWARGPCAGKAGPKL